MKNASFFFSYFILLIFIVFSACQTTDQNSVEYIASINQWQKERIKKLTAADGWTTLTGLHSLKEGSNTFGSAEDMDIQFPKKAPKHIGSFILDSARVVIDLKEDLGVTIDGQEKQITVLKTDQTDAPNIMNWKSIYWFIIKRGDKHYVRVRDTLNVLRQELKSIPHFPIDQKWKIKANFQANKNDSKVTMENVLGMKMDRTIEGTLHFDYDGKNHELVALDGGKEKLFLIIADDSTGDETYGGGRYLYIPRADKNNQTFIDFNQAENPPCAFTKYATCLLPPKENHLAFKITAGEKNYGGH
ncbi:MAG TPA: DUF1684 domain-containing protein [Bacteroidetes bacterium]|nr:DUF1684 domain-containing protein [Bacteroidota bacterium]